MRIVQQSTPLSGMEDQVHSSHLYLRTWRGVHTLDNSGVGIAWKKRDRKSKHLTVDSRPEAGSQDAHTQQKEAGRVKKVTEVKDLFLDSLSTPQVFHDLALRKFDLNNMLQANFLPATAMDAGNMLAASLAVACAVSLMPYGTGWPDDGPRVPK
ncbi:hypothetical protein CPC08DRAFT_726664 [Agrocybe pediades]|nr:hypothetical protein CPC08DRAFT_726664 [Agrocybe pediades]